MKKSGLYKQSIYLENVQKRLSFIGCLLNEFANKLLFIYHFAISTFSFCIKKARRFVPKSTLSKGLGQLWLYGYTLIQLTTVPTLSPCTTRNKFPGVFISNTMMGSLFSMQRVKAVMSITFRFFCIQSL
jgi:hypothetical protein